MPSRPITEGLLHKVLTNPYYKGQTKFQGVQYAGRHEALVDEAIWQRVQDVLASHVNGERVRQHPHFLKSTVYCGQCEMCIRDRIYDCPSVPETTAPKFAFRCRR